MRIVPIIAGMALALGLAPAIHAQTAGSSGCMQQKAAEGQGPRENWGHAAGTADSTAQKAGEGEGPRQQATGSGPGPLQYRQQATGSGPGPLQYRQRAAEGEGPRQNAGAQPCPG